MGRRQVRVRGSSSSRASRTCPATSWSTRAASGRTSATARASWTGTSSTRTSLPRTTWTTSTPDPFVEWGDPDEGILRAPRSSRETGVSSRLHVPGQRPQRLRAVRGHDQPVRGQRPQQLRLERQRRPPPRADGCMWSFADTEMGPSAAPITAAAWGPDCNATFAAIYPSVFLRCGYKKSASLSLAPSFSGQLRRATRRSSTTGNYQVPQQANVGNTVDRGRRPRRLHPEPGLHDRRPVELPLWDYTGFQAWPDFTDVLRVGPRRSRRRERRGLPLRRSVEEAETPGSRSAAGSPRPSRARAS